jgi:benzoyl-CoA-dihydrodiol lyase
MLAGAPHAHKVNFCKFTNETRNAIEAAGEESGQHYICAVKGACAGGGYELALSCDYILLSDDGSTAVSLPEVPLLAVLPGTGGLTRVTDKRKVRRDIADVFCSTEEGVKGRRAADWRLVDEVVANSKFDAIVAERARQFAERSKRGHETEGVKLTPLKRTFGDGGSVNYSTVELAVDRDLGMATITILAPKEAAPADMERVHAQGADAWMLRCARELDDVLLHLRLNELEIGLVAFKAEGDADTVVAHERVLLDNRDHWLANEILLYWKRVLKRIDLTSRSLIALVEPGSCFAGTLAEILFSVDRSYMAEGEFTGDNRPPAAIVLTEASFGLYPMSNNLTRLQTRYLGTPEKVDAAHDKQGGLIEAHVAEELGLVTYAIDDIDWDDTVRVFLEERASFSADAMTAMEANLRFAGPETMETKIFGRLTAWQNWVFQRPNAVGENGALRRYGSGLRGEYDKRRV